MKGMRFFGTLTVMCLVMVTMMCSSCSKSDDGGTDDTGYAYQLKGNWVHVVNNEIDFILSLSGGTAATLMLYDSWYAGNYTATANTITFKVNKFTMVSFNSFGDWIGRGSYGDTETLTYPYQKNGGTLTVTGPLDNFRGQNGSLDLEKSTDTGSGGMIIN